MVECWALGVRAGDIRMVCERVHAGSMWACGYVMAGRVVLGRAVRCCDECDLGLGVWWFSEKLTARFASRVLQGCRSECGGTTGCRAADGGHSALLPETARIGIFDIVYVADLFGLQCTTQGCHQLRYVSYWGIVDDMLSDSIVLHIQVREVFIRW